MYRHVYARLVSIAVVFLMAAGCASMRMTKPVPGFARIAESIAVLEEETGGTIGVSVRHLDKGWALDHRPDELFSAASVIKTHLLVVLHRMEERGELSMDEAMVLRDEDKVGGSGRLQNEASGQEYTLTELARLMIVISDNTATNMLINRAGGIDAINAEMATFGITQSRFGRLMMDMEARERGIDNLLTPEETANLFVGLQWGSVTAKPQTSQAVLDVLLGQELRGRIPALLPEGTRVANKTGSLSGICHDAGIVYTPSGPIVVVVLTKDIAERGVAENAIQKIARVVYDEWGGDGGL